jgi:hypothetical protein
MPAAPSSHQTKLLLESTTTTSSAAANEKTRRLPYGHKGPGWSRSFYSTRAVREVGAQFPDVRTFVLNAHNQLAAPSSETCPTTIRTPGEEALKKLWGALDE